MTLLLYKWYHGVNLEWNILIIVQMVQWWQSWMKHHNYCTNGTIVSIVDDNNVWDWWTNKITIVEMVRRCDYWSKYLNYCTNGRMVSIVDVINESNWWKNYITIVQMVQWCQSWMWIMCRICEKWHYYCTHGTILSIGNVNYV